MPCVAQTSGSANPALAPHTGSTHHQSRDYPAPSSTNAAPRATKFAAEPHPISTQPANTLSHMCTQAALLLHQLCSLSEPDCTLSVHRRHHHPLPQPLRGFAQAIALDPRGQRSEMPEPAPDVERVVVEHVKGSLRLHPHPFGARQVCAPLRPPVQPLTHRYTAPCLPPSRPFKGCRFAGALPRGGASRRPSLQRKRDRMGGSATHPPTGHARPLACHAWLWSQASCPQPLACYY